MIADERMEAATKLEKQKRQNKACRETCHVIRHHQYCDLVLQFSPSPLKCHPEPYLHLGIRTGDERIDRWSKYCPQGTILSNRWSITSATSPYLRPNTGEYPQELSAEKNRFSKELTELMKITDELQVRSHLMNQLYYEVYHEFQIEPLWVWVCTKLRV